MVDIVIRHVAFDECLELFRALKVRTVLPKPIGTFLVALRSEREIPVDAVVTFILVISFEATSHVIEVLFELRSVCRLDEVLGKDAASRACDEVAGVEVQLLEELVFTFTARVVSL